MPDFLNNDQSEFEREFEFDDESTMVSDEFESEYNDEEFDENEFEAGDTSSAEAYYEDEYEFENEGDYLSEFDEENEFESEFKNLPDGRYERRLYEIFSTSYENEFEFENDFNQVMHEVQRDFFFKKIKKWGKKLAPIAKLALKAIPGGGTLTDALKQITKDPRGLLKTLAMKFGPQALNAVVPGAGLALGAVLGNSETDDLARQAARDTVALARESYANFADEISRTNFSRSLPETQVQLNSIARNSFKKAQRTVRLGSKKHSYRRVNRKVEDKGNGMFKVVTITYKRV
ncbi:hypothetical protein [Pontibacter beigongshangensis]|uniref:hypothetical protein n=1 Tax=Pontibacter beigongshangensis TaxID=2574733 RepID=UPI001650700F|nr:hypothetical protein [Pontibacter beigongshangensis]